MCVIFVVGRVTGYVPCPVRFLFRRSATSTLLLKCCVFQYWHHILPTCLKPAWLRGQIQILKLEIFYYSGQGTSCSQTGNLTTFLWKIISLQINGSFWLLIMNGGYIFKLLFHPQNKCCCQLFRVLVSVFFFFRSLVKTKVKEEMRKEIQLNQKVQHLTQAH